VKTSPNVQSDERLGWRVAEFCKLVPVSRGLISKMAREGKLNLLYLGDIPIVTRIEAVRLGLLNA
jgi:hypothetical protein